ncbi:MULTISPECIES: response regulator transcription factor [unclassified Pseudomonas]|uniref:response regulator transcription factor n=1 Tax=unclassified Pseudomonas TaxID=196821 RepID=UPI0021154347|nr:MULTISPECIES: helix-turn-helix transcriptional regulator [unclassified Pseudomonas]
MEQEKESPVQGQNLSTRELDVLSCMLQAMGCKQTARRLGIGEHTVRKHRGSLLRKFGARNAAQLVALALAAKPEMANAASDYARWRWPLG